MSEATRQDLTQRARALGPSLVERARECERLRRLPDETIADFKRAGFLGAFVSPDYGGSGLEIATVIEVSRELGHACGNSAWCAAITMLHNHMASEFPVSAQDRVFAAGPDPVICGVFMPAGQGVRADGGYRLSGAWNFASTCDHSDYAILAALVQHEPGGQPVGLGNFLIERRQFRIEDNWHVSGLCGTGSKRVCVDDVFVPEDQVLVLGHGERVAQGSGAPARRRRSAGLPANSVATLGLSGVALGIAEGALERFRERLAGKLRAAPVKAGDQNVAAQLRYAASAAEVDACALIVARDCEEMTRDAEAGREATLEQRGRYRRDAAWAVATCAAAAARLAPASGANAIFLDEPGQRAVRDLQAFAAHVVADWDAAGESYTRAVLGLPKLDPLI